MSKGKIYSSAENALADVFDGATILIGGLSGYGIPRGLISELSQRDVSKLTCVFSPGISENSRPAEVLAPLLSNEQISKLICSDPFDLDNGGMLESQCRSGQVSIEMIPQGILGERLRSAGAGLGGIFLPVSLGAKFSSDDEVRLIDGEECIYVEAMRGDFSLIKANESDSLGNLIYKGLERNWAPVMAMASGVTIVEVSAIREPGDLNPELIVTPGIFVNRIVLAE